MQKTTFKVRNFRRARHANIDVAPIALLAGTNEQGKSSILQAIRASLLGAEVPFDHFPEGPGHRLLKKDAEVLVHRGQESGGVQAIGPDGNSITNWPSCTTEQDGTPPSSNAIATGAIDILMLEQDQRALQFSRYLRTAPTVDDLRPHMVAAGYDEDDVTEAWGLIDQIGWGQMEAKAKENAQKRQGVWCDVTGGKRYPPKAALDWFPQGWHQDLKDETLERLEAFVRLAKAHLEDLIGKAAVDQSEIARLRLESAEPKEPSGEKIKRLGDGIKVYRDSVRALTTEAAGLPATNPGDALKCPSCGVALVVGHSHETQSPTLKVVEAVSEKDLKAARARSAVLEEGLTTLRRDIAGLEAEIAGELAAAKTRAAAAARLAALEQKSGGTVAAEEIDAARSGVQTAEANLVLWTTKTKADKLSAWISRNAKLLDILAPSGLRRLCLVSGLAKFNAMLAEICREAGWATARVDDNLEGWMGADQAWNLSSAAYIRLKVTLQIAISRLDRNALVIVDDLDRVDPAGREGLIAALTTYGIPAVLAMVMAKPSIVPDLEKFGVGQSYWIHDGRATPLAQALANGGPK